jgi:hypothetical protein
MLMGDFLYFQGFDLLNSLNRKMQNLFVYYNLEAVKVPLLILIGNVCINKKQLFH